MASSVGFNKISIHSRSRVTHALGTYCNRVYAASGKLSKPFEINEDLYSSPNSHILSQGLYGSVGNSIKDAKV